MKNGKNSIFTAGESYFASYLFPRIIALYGLFTGKISRSEFAPKEFQIPSGDIGWFFVLQSAINMLCLIFLFFKLANFLHHGAAFLICFFLAVDPALLQFSALLFGESIFFSIIFLVLGYYLGLHQFYANAKIGKGVILRHVGLGLLLGLCYLQRPSALFWPICFAFSFLIYDIVEKRAVAHWLARTLALFSGYGCMIVMLGIANFQARHFFQILPIQSQQLLYNDFLASANFFNKSACEEEAGAYMNSNFGTPKNISEGEWNYRFHHYCHEKAIKSIFLSIDNFEKALSQVYSRTLVLLSSFDLFFAYKHVSRVYKPKEMSYEESYRRAREDSEFAKTNRLYSFVLLLLTVLGVPLFLSRANLHLSILFLLSAVVFSATGTVGFHMRYSMQNIIFLSFFGGYALYYILKSFREMFSRGRIFPGEEGRGGLYHSR